jgi:hypothetical protein
MSEQGVSLGTTSETGDTPPESPIKAKVVPIEVSGIYRGETIRQEWSLPVPPQAKNDQIILYVWESLSRSAGLIVTDSEDTYKFYPFHLFEEPLSARVKPESGVKIG